jgi:UDP-N-acetylmuramoyl-tripeptide--D-alanyl-D-alanine ligase
MTVIDESYNCSPVALKAALQVLAAAEPGPGGRRIAVLGDMLELGADAPVLHAGFAACAKAKGIDLVFTVGELMANLREALPESMRGDHAPTAAAILPALLGEVRGGDVVLVKGSRGVALESVAAALIDMKPQPTRCTG